MNDTPNPDWVAWLARAEAEDELSWPPPPPSVPVRPDRGWQRLGDVAANVVAVLGGGAFGAAVALLYVFTFR